MKDDLRPGDARDDISALLRQHFPAGAPAPALTRYLRRLATAALDAMEDEGPCPGGMTLCSDGVTCVHDPIDCPGQEQP